MHFLASYVKNAPVETAQRPGACVDAHVKSAKREPRLVIRNGIHVFKHSTQWVILPRNIPVFSEDEKHIIEGRFAISVETFDPWHVITDLSTMSQILPMLHNMSKN